MKDYYQIELEHLRDLGRQFSLAHPALAPLLSSEGADPDVERILEGTAFLCGLINQRLDENFPEIIQGLLNITAPQLLLAMPSQSLVQFTPFANAQGVQKVEQGALLSSVPVENQNCMYTVSQKTNILPAKVKNINLESSLLDSAVLSLTLEGQSSLEGWLPDNLVFYINDHLPRASQWYMLLLCNLESIELIAGSRSLRLPPSAIKPMVMRSNPFMENEEFSEWQTLRDYFNFPEKFLFVELSGVHKLRFSPEEKNITIKFNFKLNNRTLPVLHENLFILNVVPVVNAFKHSADPFVLTHARQDYRLRISGDNGKNMEVYSVESVSSLKRGGAMRHYVPYFSFDRSDGTYMLRRNVSLVNGQMEYYLGVVYDKRLETDEQETMITELVCYHPKLTSRLRVGDICNPTDSSPAMATFANIVRTTMPIPPISSTGLLWQLFSYLHTNLLPLASASAVQNFLRLYLPSQNFDPSLDRLNRSRIEAITHFEAVPEERLWQGRPVRGQLLDMRIKGSAFSTQGELYVFGSILDSIMARFATINTYTRLQIIDNDSGDSYLWPARLGKKQLL